jgi:guanylate kinase
MRSGNLFIVSAPSGTGKTTLVEELVKTVPDLVMSRSYTSRSPREGEMDGVDYHFVDEDRFTAMVEADEFLEWATVFGSRYGTSATETERHLCGGRDVVLVIDVQGAAQVRRQGLEVVGVFVMPPSLEVLECRLRGRSQGGSEEDLRRRLETAKGEVAARAEYDYVVVNDTVDQCVDYLRCIVLAQRSRTVAMADTTDRIANSFGCDGVELRELTQEIRG